MAAVAKKKKEDIIDPNKTYIFKPVNPQELEMMIPSRITVYDETGQLRELNLNPVEKSQWRDEQINPDYLEKRMLRITKGRLIISGKERYKIEFLLNHDWFSGNKGKVNPRNKAFRNKFYVEDEALKLATNRELRERITKAGQVILEAKVEDLKDFMKSEYSFDAKLIKGLSTEQEQEDALYDKALQKASEQPDKFLKDFNNPKHKIKVNIIKAFSEGLLDDLENGKIKWKDTGGVIYTHTNYKERSPVVLTSWIISGDKTAEKFYTELQAKLIK